MAENINIAGRLHSTATGNVVAGANEIFDDTKQKKQSQINQETDTALADRYTKAETYNKTELDNMITTPDVQYVTVSTYASLPASGSADTVYRVSSYDGTQVDATKYSEYAWDGTQYVLLDVKTQVGEVFDVSEYNASGGTLATYASLSALLNDANLSTIIPTGVRKGGMSVKFVLSSDNKYVQYRLVSDSFNTTPSNWQKSGAEVSVSQNTQTGHTEIHIGNNDYPVASVEEVSQLGQEVENNEKNVEIEQVGYTLIDTYLQGNGSWGTDGRKSLILKVKSEDKVYYTQAENGVYYTFFKSFDFRNLTSNMDVCSGYDFRNYTRQLTMGITVPVDAAYMCITYWVDYPTKLPIELRINDKNLFIEQLTTIDKINKLSSYINRDRVELTNKYVKAYLKNVRYSTLQVNESDAKFYTKELVSDYSEDVQNVRKDMSLPVSIEIPNVGSDVQYTLLISENPAFIGDITISVDTGLKQLYWLKTNSIYWYKILAGTTEIRNGIIETFGERRLNPCEGILNIRDLGGQVGLNGKKIRQGLLFRGGIADNMTANDKIILEQYWGIELVCGLALDTEDEDLFDVETFHPYNLPQFDELVTVACRQKYIVYLRKIIDFIKLGKPVFFHCNGGADRTGLMAAMLEGLCGVSENDICMDYELTSFSRYINGNVLSRTRMGVYNENNDEQYRNIGFGGAMKFVRTQSGDTYTDKWVSLLTDSALNSDGFTALTLSEIEIIRAALLE